MESRIGFAFRPFLLLPLLRTRYLSVLMSAQAADVGWAERFDVELLSAEQLLPVRDGTDALAQTNRFIETLPNLVRERWRGRELGLASFIPPQPEWLRTLQTAMRGWFREETLYARFTVERA